VAAAAGPARMAAMRVAVYTDYPYHRVGDGIYAERAFAVFLAELARKLGGLTVIGRLDPSESRARYPLGDGVELVPLPYYQRLSDPLPAAQAMLGSLGRYWTALGSVDCVWLLGPHPLAFPFAALALFRRKRVVLGVRQDTPQYIRNRHPGKRLAQLAAELMERSFRALGRLCDVVAVGPEIAAHYRHSRRVLEIAVSLVDEADVVDPRVAIAKEFGDELRALSVGRLEEEKNPLLLADVLAALRQADPRWKLTVCGEGALAERLAERLAELDLAEHAEILGYLPLDRGLADLYRDSHALLHVSWTEGLPQVLFEAFAAGLPVVATDVGGIAAAVGDAVLLVAAGDAAAPARDLARIGNEPALRAELIEAGNAAVRARTLQTEVRRTAEFLIGEAGF
jgi:glycosyltransferase involved in cell wall biosynthesis